MPESPNVVSSGQRRANWVGLRTLRQLPKAVGETADGEPIYEIRSVRLLLHGTAANFVRLTVCSRCGRELAGSPVLTAADLDRHNRPMICSDCVRSAGVSTVWDFQGAEPAPAAEVEPAPAPATAPANATAPAPAPVNAPEPVADPPPPARLDVLERHLRAVTDRVNELGRITRAQQADAKERDQREEVTASTLREEMAGLRASMDDARAEMQRLADAQAGLERWRAERPPVAGAGVAPLGEELARLTELAEAQRADLAALAAAQGETQQGHDQLVLAHQALDGRLVESMDRQETAPVDQGALSKVEELIAARVADAEVRLAGEASRESAVDLAKIEELIAGRVAETGARLAEEAARSSGVDLARVEALVAGRVADMEGRLAAVVEELVAGRLADMEGRLAHQIAGQWGDLETAIEASVTAAMARLARASEEAVGARAELEARVEALAGQLAEETDRLDTMLDRLHSVERAADGARSLTAGMAAGRPAADRPGASLLDSLDRQLEAAAKRLAERSETRRGEP